MKKLIVIVLIALGGFLLYKYYFSSSADKGAYDENGKPSVIVFVMDDCGAPCAGVADVLNKKNIPFENINISTDEGKGRFEKYGENGVPLTVIGERRIVGDNIPEIENVLAEIYSNEVLSPAEQMVMKNHFDDNGKPIVVMYGTSWCSNCRKMREYMAQKNIPFKELDVEKDGKAKDDYAVLKGICYPLTYVGYRRIIGFDGEKISQAAKELL